MAYTLTYQTITSVTCKVIGYTGTPDNVVVPETFGGRSVIEIEDNTFNSTTAHSSLLSVQLPSTIKTLGLRAFFECENLTSINLPEGLTSLGANVFAGCHSLENITLPSTLTTMGTGCFNNCDSFTEITIPSGVTSFGSAMFNGCDNIQSVTILANVTSLGLYTFGNCYSLVTVDIPDSITSLGDNCFYLANRLEAIQLPASLTSIGTNCFYGCELLTEVSIPEGVTTIGAGAFFGCTELASINIPSGVSILNASTFGTCESLPYIEIPSAVTSIGNYCFSGCTLLSKIFFVGNEPTFGVSCFDDGSLSGESIPATAYIISSTTGWPTPPEGVGDPLIPTAYAQALISFPVLTVDNASAFSEADTLCLISSGRADGFGISSVDEENNLIEIVPGANKTYSTKGTVVSPLVLSRFEEPSIDFSFKTDELSVMDTSFLEVPEEYTPDIVNPSGENGTRAYLYKFDVSGTSLFFTSFENDLTYSGDTYLARPFEHAGITDDINMERNEVEIRSRRFWNEADEFDRNPLSLFLPLRVEAPMPVEIIEATLTSAGAVASVATIYKGEVATASFDGPMITAKCTGLSSLFDRVVPTMLMQPTCNYAVFGESCGLVADDWKFYAEVVDYPFSSDPYKILVSPPSFVEPLPSIPRPEDTPILDHYFAGGRFEKGSGATLEKPSILDSVPYTGNVVLTLRSPLVTAPVAGDVVYLWPGCDGRAETCKAYDDTVFRGVTANPTGKFGNYKRFGGFPFIPIGNPSVAKINKDYSQGGKK